MQIIYSIAVPAIVSFAVSIWLAKKIFKKTVAIMKKMDADQEKANQDLRGMILKEIQSLRQLRETNFTESNTKR